MTDYATLKVPELKKLLQEKSLPVTGNKADLIARLSEHDKSSEPAKPCEFLLNAHGVARVRACARAETGGAYASKLTLHNSCRSCCLSSCCRG